MLALCTREKVAAEEAAAKKAAEENAAREVGQLLSDICTFVVYASNRSQ